MVMVGISIYNLFGTYLPRHGYTRRKAPKAPKLQSSVFKLWIASYVCVCVCVCRVTLKLRLRVAFNYLLSLLMLFLFFYNKKGTWGIWDNLYEIHLGYGG